MSNEQLAAEISSSPSPLRRVRTNAGPTMMPLWETSDELLGGLSCKELAQRIIYTECRSSLPSEILQKMEIDLANRLISSDAKPPSVEQALKEVAEERASSTDDANAISLLDGYATFLSERRSKILQFLAAQ